MRNLIGAGDIAPGVVAEGDLRDLEPTDLARYEQCHFFAGIGLWSCALRLAGWPDDRPVWTGSCPCQPWSIAGAKRGADDERDLWPDWFKLIRVCRPPVLFGEQVASKDAMGWLDTVFHDLEAEGYAVGAADLCAAGCGAPHVRQRLYWVAHTQSRGLGMQRWTPRRAGHALGGGADRGLGHAEADGRNARTMPKPGDWAPGNAGGSSALGHGWLGHADGEGLPLRERQGLVGPRWGQEGRAAQQSSGPLHGPWADADWLQCTDGKARPVEPGSFPLAHGLPKNLGDLSPELRRMAEVAGLDDRSLILARRYRVGSLKAFGNAIVAALAAEFVSVAMQVIDHDLAPDLSIAN